MRQIDLESRNEELMMRWIDRVGVPALAAVATLTMVAALYMVFFYAPVEAQMGIVQKIFYMHVPAAMAMYAGFAVAALCSLLYLLKPSTRWDIGAQVGAEMGLGACVFVLISGPLWAYKAWGTFWTWDPQLTATFVLFLMYAGYVVMRSFGGEGKGVKKVAAVLALLAIVNVPIVHYAVELWGGMHPVVEREGGGGLATEMAQTLQVSMVGFLLMFALLMWMHYRGRVMKEDLNQLYLEAEDLARLNRQEVSR